MKAIQNASRNWILSDGHSSHSINILNSVYNLKTPEGKKLQEQLPVSVLIGKDKHDDSDARRLASPFCQDMLAITQHYSYPRLPEQYKAFQENCKNHKLVKDISSVTLDQFGNFFCTAAYKSDQSVLRGNRATVCSVTLIFSSQTPLLSILSIPVKTSHQLFVSSVNCIYILQPETPKAVRYNCKVISLDNSPAPRSLTFLGEGVIFAYSNDSILKIKILKSKTKRSKKDCTVIEDASDNAGSLSIEANTVIEARLNGITAIGYDCTQGVVCARDREVLKLNRLYPFNGEQFTTLSKEAVQTCITALNFSETYLVIAQGVSTDICLFRIIGDELCFLKTIAVTSLAADDSIHCITTLGSLIYLATNGPNGEFEFFIEAFDFLEPLFFKIIKI